MATLIERPEEDENEEYATLEQPEELAPEQPQDETPEQEDALPDKYRNKDIKDIVQMHQEAEKLLGKQSSEVGELRKIVDDFVKTQTQLSLEKESPQAQDEEIDFFYDLQAAINKAIDRHPKVKEAEQYTQQARHATIVNQLQSKHPDYGDIVRDEEFGKWIQASKVRTELFVRADKQFDFDSADELLTLWKERQQAVSTTETMQKADRDRQARAASTGSAKGSGEAPSRKIYRRADIIELMQKDPKRYNAMSDEIMKAYAEGRVK